jgi:CBS domain containing-hemolysin-like protein
MISDLILTLFLVFLNGFFVAAEFAIVKVRSSQIEAQDNIKQNLARMAKNIVNNLDAYLAATQLGITLASLGLGWVGERVTANIIVKILLGLHLEQLAWFNFSFTVHAFAIPIAFAFITVMHIVFGELAPKSIAIRYPTTTTFAIAWPLHAFYFVFRPIIWTMNGLANFILRILGIKPIHGSEIHSEEELRMIITESHEGGAIEQTERELIQNVFDFDDRRVWDILTQKKNMAAISVDTTLKEAMEFAIREGYSRYPVYGESIDDIKGIIYTKDLMKRMMETANEAESIMPLLRKVYFIAESKKIKDLLKEFQQKHIHLALVTNEIGEVAGIVTMEDILEELVGEIQDEYDNEKPFVEKTPQGTYLVSAHHSLSDINKFLPHRFEENESYETLSGMIAYQHQQELKVGEQLRIDPYMIMILKTYNNSAESVELTIIPEEKAETER